jgi:hypothetical protein
MMQTSTHSPDKRTEAADRMKRAKPNRMQKAQVLPPHQVDLTLPQSPRHDVHVPAHMSGSDLSRGGPEIAADAAKAKGK